MSAASASEAETPRCLASSSVARFASFPPPFATFGADVSGASNPLADRGNEKPSDGEAFQFRTPAVSRELAGSFAMASDSLMRRCDTTVHVPQPSSLGDEIDRVW
jgi:hypothetical protein